MIGQLKELIASHKPKCNSCYYSIAEIYQQLQRYHDAIKYYKVPAPSHLLLSTTTKRKAYLRFLQEGHKAINDGAGGWEGWVGEAECQSALGDEGAAAECYKHAVKLNPRAALYNRYHKRIITHQLNSNLLPSPPSSLSPHLPIITVSRTTVTFFLRYLKPCQDG